MSKGDFEPNPLVGVIMGSESDLEVMQHSALMLERFAVPHEVRIISAHRTPDKMVKYGKQAVKRGLQVIIAGAGGSAHLPGEIAALTPLPVKGVALGKTPKSIDHAIGSMIGMPKGVPLDFMGINQEGAVNAALESVRILGLNDEGYAQAYDTYVEELGTAVEQTDARLRKIGLQAFLRERRMAESDFQFG